MKCPHCDQELKLVDGQTPYRNSEIYRKNNLCTTACCGHAVVIRPVTTFDVVKYVGHENEDFWGNPIKPLEITQ
jgi:vancomycin resistance protein YoaR